MQVNDVMTTTPVTVDPGSPLDAAVEAMLEANVGSVLVLGDDGLGILTDRDVLRASHYLDAPLPDLTARDAMTPDPVTIAPDATVSAALRLMEEHDVKKLPVVDGFDLVGIVTATDIADHQPERVRDVRSTVDRRDEWTG